jgi:hypothetical protein
MNNPKTRDDDERSSIANSVQRGKQQQPKPHEDPEPLQKPEGLDKEQRRFLDNRSTPGHRQ